MSIRKIASDLEEVSSNLLINISATTANKEGLAKANEEIANLYLLINKLTSQPKIPDKSLQEDIDRLKLLLKAKEDETLTLVQQNKALKNQLEQSTYIPKEYPSKTINVHPYGSIYETHTISDNDEFIEYVFTDPEGNIYQKHTEPIKQLTWFQRFIVNPWFTHYFLATSRSMLVKPVNPPTSRKVISPLTPYQSSGI